MNSKDKNKEEILLKTNQNIYINSENKGSDYNKDKNLNKKQSQEINDYDYIEEFDYRDIIPENLHTLYELVGRSKYESIIKAYGGGQLYIQKEEKYKRAIQAKQIYFEYIHERASYKDLRKKYRLCETTIRNIIKKFMEDEKNKK